MTAEQDEPPHLDARTFLETASANPVNAALLSRLPALGLRQCHLTAGCLYQAYWNWRSGFAPERGVKDYDVFYFDERDLSWEAEDAVIRQVYALTADLGVEVEVKNQARVHLWYERRFGASYPRLTSARDGIDRYLIECTCVGIDVMDGSLYAPNGLAGIGAGVLRMNPRNPQPELFRQKAETLKARWPWLRIIG
ncbi:nucleotidyltransferase family protein [Consotaella aegiceratis]|uniref:nucleotidyltransferase family protein n=1 Tax=Consotaella aegiceratis TaxID=3097961 RepID=UPI002F3EC0BC